MLPPYIPMWSRRALRARCRIDNPAPSLPCPPSPRLPWDYHLALRPERLRLGARLLAHAHRRDILALAREELGDDIRPVGCRAYAFGRVRLRRVAEAGAHVPPSLLFSSLARLRDC